MSGPVSTDSSSSGKSATSASDPAICVENLVIAYGKGAKRQVAVDGISFEVREGETVGFIGPNGAGKSSTIKALMGFHFPASGSMRIFSKPVPDVHVRTRIGYLPEVTQYYPFMKARELLELYGGLSGLSKAQLRERIPYLLKRVGLDGKAEVLIQKFSKGMQQRVGIAQALISDPDLLILDELSSGLDPVGRYDLRETMLELKAQGKTIFFSSHELHEVEDLCDRIIVLNGGKKIADEPLRPLLEKLRQGSEGPISLERYFMSLIRPPANEAAAS
jgi:ABC-2 type transport system ATP-binding protein